MGLLVNGEWVDQWYDTSSTGGKFIPPNSQFRNWLSRDGSSGFKAEAGRYHLYISLACPWAHRALIIRKLKGLEEAISLTVVNPLKLSNGWEFAEESPDPLGNTYLYQVYLRAKSDYTGRVTVPVLWDKQTNTIVNNESSDILQMLNSEFDSVQDDYDYYPEEMKEKIDEINSFVYENINSGVYRWGFATSQEAYEEAIKPLFDALDRVEDILSRQRYLAGDRFTIADIRLFTTLARFDAVYAGLFKCNLKSIEDYPNISNFLRDLYQFKGIGETVDFDHIKRGYYVSIKEINPTQVVPTGPLIDYNRPHDRDRFNN